MKFEELHLLEDNFKSFNWTNKIGKISKSSGLLLEADGPKCQLGDMVTIVTDNEEKTIAEVVGFKEEKLLLMPLKLKNNFCFGSKVYCNGRKPLVPVGQKLLGRVIDALGNPIDSKGPLNCNYVNDCQNEPPNPTTRPLIEKSFSTSVKAIDTFVPLGLGQRVGIFAGSGVGKSTLLAMMARGSESDVNVIAFIGERGRELNEFIINDLGEEGLKKSVIVVATSDQPASLRLRAAFVATRIAESFRDDGKNVLFLFDSLTRLAMAQREIGLSLGEPPATRGYPPSVFAVMPKLLERAGMSEHGAITAFYTVLVEGDDLNEPITDTARSILDGHIVLSRTLANANHFPAIDVLDSISRLSSKVISVENGNLVSLARDLLSTYRRNEDLISVGAYKPGSNPKLDNAVNKNEKLSSFLKQSLRDQFGIDESFVKLQEIVGS